MSGCCPAVAGRKRVTRLELATSSLGDAFAEVIKVSRKPEESVLLRSQLRLQRPHLRRNDRGNLERFRSGDGQGSFGHWR